jgi:hypothetical protein
LPKLVESVLARPFNISRRREVPVASVGQHPLVDPVVLVDRSLIAKRRIGRLILSAETGSWLLIGIGPSGAWRIADRQPRIAVDRIFRRVRLWRRTIDALTGGWLKIRGRGRVHGAGWCLRCAGGYRIIDRLADIDVFEPLSNRPGYIIRDVANCPADELARALAQNERWAQKQGRC